jgi:hypothetical protein
LISLAETVPHAGQKIFCAIKWVELNSAQNLVIRGFGQLWRKIGIPQLQHL